MSSKDPSHFDVSSNKIYRPATDSEERGLSGWSSSAVRHLLTVFFEVFALSCIPYVFPEVTGLECDNLTHAISLDL
jgi:hypothetical protein